MDSAIQLPRIVPSDAIPKAPNNGPHFSLHPRNSAPNNKRGVASCREISCNALVAGDPPGGNIPMDPRTNAANMAVTGGPSNFPTRLVVTIGCWDNVATVARVAIFPHASCLPINGNGNAGSDDEVGVRVGVHRSWVCIGWTPGSWTNGVVVGLPVRGLGDAGLETLV
mmetsp:Transcript_50832/g.61179  ORF Transcript_50832/g.61179 Transcript_50832/m.61179 type:complete len:168 (-) Transcript_50832:120-623(-)